MSGLNESTHITFRGIEDVEIKFRYGGYDGETGVTEFEWEFADSELGASCTDEEQEEVDKEVFEIASDPHRYDDDIWWYE